jgi:methylenetetrahydrofolate reductase (NADPH)
MSLASTFASKNLVVSCELFPPKSEAGEQSLYSHVDRLMQFGPDFITCTYGAGGSTRDKTLQIIDEVKKRFKVPVASHLTLVGSTADDLRDYLSRARRQGVDYIVALRGDPPQGESEFRQTAGGFRFANELVDLVRAEFAEFGVLVAGYPEKHREAPSFDVDLDNLKRKVDAGADVVVTQLFYNNDDFFHFRDRCRSMGIEVPIVPGLLPVTSLHQIQRIASLCGAVLPQDFVSRLGEKDDEHWQFEVGVEQAIAQTTDLMANGVEGLHFYVLNKSDATSRILEAMNLN